MQSFNLRIALTLTCFTFLITGNAHGQLAFRKIRTIETGLSERFPNGSLQQDLMFSPNSQFVVATLKGKAVVVDTMPVTHEPRIVQAFSVIAASRAMKFCFLQGSEDLIVAGDQEFMRWVFKTKKLEEIEIPKIYCTGIGCDSKAKTLAIGHLDQFSDDGIISLLDFKTKEIKTKLTVSGEEGCNGCSASVDHIQFLPSSEALITDSSYYDDDSGSSYRIQLWDIATSKRKAEFEGLNSCLSPDGKTLAFEHRTFANAMSNEPIRRVKLFDTESLKIRWQLPGEASIFPASWSADGKWLAVICDDKTVQIWDMVQKSKVAVVEGHNSEIVGAALSPDGKKLATSCNDGVIRIWSLDN